MYKPLFVKTGSNGSGGERKKDSRSPAEQVLVWTTWAGLVKSLGCGITLRKRVPSSCSCHWTLFLCADCCLECNNFSPTGNHVSYGQYVNCDCIWLCLSILAGNYQEERAVTFQMRRGGVFYSSPVRLCHLVESKRKHHPEQHNLHGLPDSRLQGFGRGLVILTASLQCCSPLRGENLKGGEFSCAGKEWHSNGREDHLLWLALKGRGPRSQVLLASAATLLPYSSAARNRCGEVACEYLRNSSSQFFSP